MKKLFGKAGQDTAKKGRESLVSKFKNSKKFRIISILLVVLIVAGCFFGPRLFRNTKETATQKAYAQVSRGTVNNVIEGTGTVEAISQYEITSLAKGDVIADYFEVGDYVTKDQLLYEIDSASMDKSITRQRSSVEKAETNYREALDDVANLTIKSTISGVISNMYVSLGDTVQQGAKIADIINKDDLRVTLPFGKHDALNMSAGNSASVTLSKSLTTVPGTVTRVATGAYVNSYGVEVTDVEIEFSNPGTILEGETVSAVVGNYACYDTATVEYMASKTITAKTGGEVKYLYKGKGDRVNSGETMVVLESTSATRSSRDAQMSLQDARLSLDDLYDNLDDYSIRSPIDGKVIQKNIKAGEKLDSNSSAAMAIVADLSKLTFEISIDELDISDISVGQKVSITADALPGQNFTGEISNISIVGSAYQGVTSYPVTVTIDNTEESDLIPGMNVSAQIIVASAENVLRIPVSAVHMGNLVIVKDDGTFADPVEMMKQQLSSSFGAMRNQNANKSAQDENKKDENGATDASKMDKMPQGTAPRGEMPEGAAPRGQMPEGAAPRGQMPEGATPRGEMPEGAAPRGQMPEGAAPRGEMPEGAAPRGQMPEGATPRGEMPQSKSSQDAQTPAETNENAKQDKDAQPKSSEGTEKSSQKDGNTEDRAAERIKSMIANLDVPQGYTVVMVQTGLTDGTYIEVKEIEGSLKEGDTVVLSVVSQSNTGNSAFGGMGGGMPGAMGGGMPGAMGGGMPGGMRSGMSGSMGGGMSGGMRSGAVGGNRSGMR